VSTQNADSAPEDSSGLLSIFHKIASERKTTKVLATDDLEVDQDRHVIERMIACAGWAPFHKVCSSEHRSDGVMSGIEPWRFHLVDSDVCRQLRSRVQTMEGAGKIPAMLSAAKTLVMATWLPNPLQSQPPAGAVASYFDPTEGNVEHIAAAAAAVQSLLLAATAAGLPNYWSSGGVLRSHQVFSWLGIPSREQLLGAIFLFPQQLPHKPHAEVVFSKLRDQRSAQTSWSRWVSLEDADQTS
jgi:nitroreductase